MANDVDHPPAPGIAVQEEWVMTRRQQVTVFCALVLALTTGVVAVALGLALAAGRHSRSRPRGRPDATAGTPVRPISRR